MFRRFGGRGGRVTVVITAALCVAVGVGVSACGRSSHASTKSSGSGPITIGVDLDETSYLAVDDLPALTGIKLAVQQINANGGIDGHQVKIVAKDDASDPQTAVSDAQSLVSSDHAVALIGGTASSPAAAVDPIAKSNNMPQFVIANVNPTMKNTWSISPATSYNIETRLSYLKSQGVKKIAVLADTTPYSKFLQQSTSQLAPKYGMTITGTATYASTATNLRPQLQKLLAGHPQAILQMGAGPAKIIAAKGLAQAGVSIPLIVDQDAKSLVAQATAAYSNTTWPAAAAEVYSVLSTSQRSASLTKFMSLYHGKDDSYFVARGWDLMQLAAKAMEQAHSVDGKQVLTSLASGPLKYDGATANFSLKAGESGVVSNPYYLAEIKSGQPKLLGSSS